MTAQAWMRNYYELCDAKDVDACMGYWVPDGKLRFANAEPVLGAEAIRAWIIGFVNSVAKQTHRLLHVWELPDGYVAFEAEVDTIRLDGGEVTVRGGAICRVEAERFLEQRTFVDMAPVYAPAVRCGRE